MKSACIALAATIAVFVAVSLHTARSQRFDPLAGGSDSTTDRIEVAETRASWSQYQAMEKRSADLAAELKRQARSGATDRAALEQKRDELRALIAASFRLRQALLQSEVVGFRQRISEIEQVIVQRDQNQKQIIDRRLQELTDDKLAWEPGVASRAPSAERPMLGEVAKTKEEPKGLTRGAISDSVQELEGVWDLNADLAARGTKGSQEKIRFVVHGSRGAIFRGDLLAQLYSIKIDPSATPRRIEMMSLRPQTNASVFGIYEIQGDDLRLSFGPDRNLSPAEFGGNRGFEELRFKRTSKSASQVLIEQIFKTDPAGPDSAHGDSRRLSVNNLRYLMLAMHNYVASYNQNRFPPPVLYGKDGKGKYPHSWRVALLPYLEEVELYNQYHFDEPWDSEHNRKLLPKMPKVFRSPHDAPDSVFTSYFGITTPNFRGGPPLAGGLSGGASGSAPGGGLGGSDGPGGNNASDPNVVAGPNWSQGTIFSNPKGTSFAEIYDGLSNTIALVEAKQPIPWTKPEDISWDLARPFPSMIAWYPQGWNVGFADGAVKFISNSNDDATLRALFTIGNGENVQPKLALPAFALTVLCKDEKKQPLFDTTISIFKVTPGEGSSKLKVESVTKRRVNGEGGFRFEDLPVLWEANPETPDSQAAYYVYLSSPTLPLRSLRVGRDSPTSFTVTMSKDENVKLDVPPGHIVVQTPDGVSIVEGRDGLEGSARLR